jgi:alpha-tubulin suppressor-like RCC1 family protein
MKISILRQWTSGGFQKAFALPTVLVASTVMLAVLTVTLTSVQSGTIVALDNTHYDKYVKSAAQSGLVMAKACLRANNYVASWSSNSLKPNTNCTGAVQSTSPDRVYVYRDTNEGVQTYFTVEPPTTLANGVQKLTITATAERFRQSTGAVWRTYTKTSYASISVQASFNSVAFGYQSNGAFFGVIDPQGNVTSVGYNGYGQLGNASTSNAATPQSYKLPTTSRASRLFSNFLSVGSNMFAITSDGQLYGSGLNSSGQLGNGTTSTAQSTPVKFNLPNGVTAVYVSPGQDFTFVIGSDNNVYSAGSCNSGVLGYGYSINGCSNQSTYKRLALPAVNLSDPNTLPVADSDWVQSTNITTDRLSGFLRMQGGKVYGWGKNDLGQLGTGNTTDTSTPVQITDLGNAGQPKATQVAFDGDSTWILDDTGNVWATGYNNYGSLGTGSPIGSASGKCISNSGNSTTDGAAVIIYGCNNTASQLLEWTEDGSLKFRPNSTTEKCVDNTNGSVTNGNPIRIKTCDPTSVSQKWTLTTAGKLYNGTTGKCIENPNNSTTDSTQLILNTCSTTVGYPAQTWNLKPTLTPTKVVLPENHGGVARITTDQWTTLFLMTDGTIWGYGLNTAAQLGAGNISTYNPRIRQFIIPAGRKAVNFYTAKTGGETTLQYANTFAILDDGSVYGSGANTFGQLGNGATSASQITTPIKMNLPTGVRAQTVQYGFGSTVLLTTEGKIYTVGNNSNGQLGDGTLVNSSTPQARQYVNNRPIVLY